MIFLTIGTQLGFDRLVQAVDAWAEQNPSETVIAQIGQGQYKPKYMEYTEFLSPTLLNQRMSEANLLVAHAGMGTLLTALRMQKPIVIMPRKAELKEQRNDHQFATAKWISKYDSVQVAWDESEIAAILNARAKLQTGKPFPEYANEDLLFKLSNYIEKVV